ncbi:MAG: ABC transporter permease [Micromonosporaceae bacterium]|nr:ABC transporter permease [Micromonosporaceae bacterium]
MPGRPATFGPLAAGVWRVLAIAQRHAYVLRRSPHRLFDVVVWPAVDVVLFGSIGIFAASRSGTGAQQVALYLLVGVVLWHVVYQAQIALATGFLEETWSRSLLSLMVTPLREWEYVLGVALFGLVKLVFGVGAVALIAWLAYAFKVTSVGFGLIPIAALLLAVGWAIALFVIGLVLRFGSGAEALAWGILFVVMPLSGTFYPVSALPGVLRPVAQLLPTTHAFAAGRALASGQPVPWGEFGMALGGTTAMLAAGIAFLVWMLRIFRARGFITRYS